MKQIGAAVSVKTSADVADIIAITKRSAQAKTDIRIIELSTLNNLVPFRTAEAIRRKLLQRGVHTRQLTNLRNFQPWTNVQGYVEQCMQVRYASAEVLPINTEILLFDDVVAFYQVEPTVSVTVIEHAAFAEQQRALFDNFWNMSQKLNLHDDGSTTYGVTIRRSPREVYEYVSQLSNWPEFSDFAANFERVTDDEYIAHTTQGDIRVIAQFDPEKLLLDTVCVLPNGSSDFIPYRVVPNKDGAELIMTNFMPSGATQDEYNEQLLWMDIELQRIKQRLEQANTA